MTDDQKKQLALFGIFGAVVYAVSRPKVVARYRQGRGTMTTIQLVEAYRELVSDPVRVFINPTDENEPDTGTPWAVDLASFTKNYATVKAEYARYYERDLSADLLAWFSPIELSQYVAALWEKNKTVMS
jgi:hypothetical protein